MRARVRIEVGGAVQGVGFRPFVYRLARECACYGWVANDPRGVRIEAEGEREALERFVTDLRERAPGASRVERIDCEWVDPVGYDGFRIRQSERHGAQDAEVLPDLAACPACLAEVADPHDRRHGYPFANCTECGPRFSIVRSLPYDRSRTTMAEFDMCSECSAEYEAPGDRRFHAQPNACPACGPQVALRDGDGRILASHDAALDATYAALHDGRIVAVKGLGGFHLMVDARNGEALARLRGAKPRREKPLALMVRDLAAAEALCRLDDEARDSLGTREAPILLLPRREGVPVHESVAPGCPSLGIMLAYTPLHRLLLERCGFPLVATSGNRKDEPICTDESEAVERLAGVAERFLVHDRPIARHVDDSVAWIVRGETRLLRRARGFAPRPVRVPGAGETVLAVGAHLKNAVALAIGGQVVVGQHIGDMETPQALDAFERSVDDLLALYRARPAVVAHDLHPDYATTRWATEWAGRADRSPQRIAVQHHHAHLAACLAENRREEEALGVIWDGTGYGPDGTVWGGEFLVGNAAGYRRVAHLRPFRLPGGDAAIREPRRVALALLWEMHGRSALEGGDLAPQQAFEPTERALLAEMLERGVCSPVTTSAGRLFDALAALTGLRQTSSFEGQAAMELEFAADPGESGEYPVPLTPAGGVEPYASSPVVEDVGHRRRRASQRAPRRSERDSRDTPDRILDWWPLMEAALTDLRCGAPAGVVSARFHNALAGAIVRVAREVGVSTVALSGGCFQNRRLLESAAARLERAGFDVLLHRQVPPNDGGIALGQAVVARAQGNRAPA